MMIDAIFRLTGKQGKGKRFDLLPFSDCHFSNYLISVMPSMRSAKYGALRKVDSSKAPSTIAS